MKSLDRKSIFESKLSGKGIDVWVRAMNFQDLLIGGHREVQHVPCYENDMKLLKECGIFEEVKDSTGSIHIHFYNITHDLYFYDRDSNWSPYFYHLPKGAWIVEDPEREPHMMFSAKYR